MRIRSASIVFGLAILLAGAGCSTTILRPEPPTRVGFLSNYSRLKKIDENSWRYVDEQRLAYYDHFIIRPVTVMPTNVGGSPLTDADKAQIAEVVRTEITKAMQERYQIVTVPSSNTAEIFVAITNVYQKGSHVGFSVEGELLDSYSSVQIAAITKSQVGQFRVRDVTKDRAAHRIVGEWAQTFREIVDEAHRNYPEGE